MASLIGQCSTCCTCPTPNFLRVSRSASKTKGGGGCGFVSPDDGKIYLTQTETYSQSSYYPPPQPGFEGDSCSQSTSFTQVSSYSIDSETGSCSGPNCSGSGSSSQNVNAAPGPSPRPYTESCTSSLVSCDNWLGSVTNSAGAGSTTTIYSPCGSCTVNVVTSDVFTYSDEYTTAILKNATSTSLPAWNPIPACGLSGSESDLASAELSSDETSYSIMQSKYQWCFSVSPTGYYALTWDETFTPDGVGSPTNTPKTFTWDGVIPSEYNINDPSTWPKSPVNEVDEPSSNGSISISNLVITCTRS